MIWIGIAFILIGIAVWPFRLERQRKVMEGAARDGAPGQFVDLSDGTTHYEWLGPPDGPVVVCIHGLTTPSFVWKGLASGLAALGYRILIYDLFGRGYSDRPAGLQDSAFFIRQLNELLASQKVETGLTVLGYSMGGAIATAFGAAHPDRIRQLVLIAPAGIRLPAMTFQRRLLNWPFLGDWMMLLRYPKIQRKGVEEERDLPSSVPDICDRILVELEYRGYLPSVLASLRGILSAPLRAEHEVISQAGLPVLCLLGETDPLIPPAVAAPLSDWNPSARVEVIAGSGHGLPYTHTRDTLARIKDFLAPVAK